VPVLVTNADLWVVHSDFAAVSLETGQLPIPPDAAMHDFVVLKQPFPTPDKIEFDFRDIQNPPAGQEYWPQLHKESVYVVKASALDQFLSVKHRDFLRSTC
jgi:hypothetical protein